MQSLSGELVLLFISLVEIFRRSAVSLHRAKRGTSENVWALGEGRLTLRGKSLLCSVAGAASGERARKQLFKIQGRFMGKSLQRTSQSSGAGRRSAGKRPTAF